MSAGPPRRGGPAPVDALIVINELNDAQLGGHGGRLPVPPPGRIDPPTFIDPNGDDFASPVDALLVINFLNTKSGGESEAVFESSSTPPAGPIAIVR